MDLGREEGEDLLVPGVCEEGFLRRRAFDLGRYGAQLCVDLVRVVLRGGRCGGGVWVCCVCVWVVLGLGLKLILGGWLVCFCVGWWCGFLVLEVGDWGFVVHAFGGLSGLLLARLGLWEVDLGVIDVMDGGKIASCQLIPQVDINDAER